jgi:hypothetical protein
MWWHYCVVSEGGALPPRVRGASLRRATDSLVDKGISGHEVLGFAIDDDTGGPTGSLVRFAGESVIRAWLDAMAIVESSSSLFARAPTAETWRELAAHRTGRTETEFRALEVLLAGGDPAVDRARKRNDYSAWRYALAIAQGKPLLARMWKPQR